MNPKNLTQKVILVRFSQNGFVTGFAEKAMTRGDP